MAYFSFSIVLFFARSPYAPQVAVFDSNARKYFTDKLQFSTDAMLSKRWNSNSSDDVRTPSSPRLDSSHQKNGISNHENRYLPIASEFPLRNESQGELILGYQITGGVGNQIINILEALYLVRQVGATFLLPPVLPRADIENATMVRSIRPGTRVWDIEKLESGTRGRRVYSYLPPQCDDKIDIVYLFVRQNGMLPQHKTVPRAVQEMVCSQFLAGGNTTLACPDDMLKDTTVLVRRQTKTQHGDRMFINELASLSSKQQGKAVCVWISGHSYDRQDENVLYSQMHYLDASRRLAKIAPIWPLSNMAVIHIRYDEYRCDSKTPEFQRHIGTKVCVSLNENGATKRSAVAWVPITAYVSVIGDKILKEGASSVYLAAAPYVPKETVTSLTKRFSDVLKVEQFVIEKHSFNLDLMDVNFLERELAIHCNIFVADFHSSWSSTIYFKRRTLGKSTLWANKILGVGSDIALFEDNSPLDFPQL